MNDKKLKRLFELARREPGPAPRADFAADVLRSVHNAAQPEPMSPLSLWEHLNGLFPRVALAALVVIALCVAADWGVTASGLPDVNDGAAQMTAQYFFNAEDL